MSLVEVTGRVVAGHGVASGRNGNPLFPGGTIAMQAGPFAERGLDLSSFHRGTINVSIEPHRLVMLAPRHVFRDVRWHPTEPPEDFSFADCRITVGDHSVEGLVYHPHPETKPTHHQPTSVVELMGPYLPGIAGGVEVTVAVDVVQAEFV